MTHSHSYQGTRVETQHRTIYITSSRELSQDEVQNFCEKVTEKDVDQWNPEEGVQVTVGSIYHSERTGSAD